MYACVHVQLARNFKLSTDIEELSLIETFFTAPDGDVPIRFTDRPSH